MSRALALLSGGLDSGVAAADHAARGGRVEVALTFDYGQRALARECEAARRLAGRLGAEWQCIELPWLAAAAQQSGAALVRRDRALPVGTVEQPGDAASAAAVWIPARNAVFVAIGAAVAESRGLDTVLAGFNREEAVTFPDNSPAFVAAACDFLRHGTRNHVSVASPTLPWDKREIVARARALGLAATDFWSCYEGHALPCGRCESCLRSNRAWGA